MLTSIIYLAVGSAMLYFGAEWIIKGAFIKDASFSDMNWDDDGTANTIDMTIGMDYCVLNF